MKAPFETVVEENTAWLFALVRKHTDSRETAEDLLQEIWIRAFRVYDSYCEDGRLRHWLSRIALNHIRNTASRSTHPCPVSLDIPVDGENDPLSAFLSDGASPEEDYLRSELTAEVLTAVAKLPEVQRQVVTFRYLDGLSVEETSKVMQIPKGTVKSKTHYAIGEIRKMLGLEDAVRPEKKKRKGVSTMECKEMVKYLFMYAMGKLPAENKAAVEEHLKNCKVCANIVTALEKLIPTMVFAEEGEISHYSITFFDLDLSYVGIRTPVPDHAERNRLLEEWNGKIPDDQNWFDCGHHECLTTVGTFDNEGNEIDYPVYKTVDNHCRHKAVSMKKVYPDMWLHDCMITTSSSDIFWGITKEENIYHGRTFNYFGGHVKSALYMAIPANAKNIKIKRGNGVIDCGTYKFAFVDRYVAEDEQLALDFTYTLD